MSATDDEQQFVSVPVQIDDKGYPDYDAWLYLEQKYEVDVREIEGYLLNGYLVEAEEGFRKYGLIMSIEENGGCEMITVSDPRDTTWYVGIQMVTEAALYKPIHVGGDNVEYQRAPVLKNHDETVNFDGWEYLERKYKLPVAALKLAIIHLDDDAALNLAESEYTYGEFPEHPEVTELSVKHRRNMKQEYNDAANQENADNDSGSDDDALYDEFQIICDDPNNPSEYPRYVGVQVRTEALLYRNSSTAGQGVRRVN